MSLLGKGVLGQTILGQSDSPTNMLIVSADETLSFSMDASCIGGGVSDSGIESVTFGLAASSRRIHRLHVSESISFTLHASARKPIPISVYDTIEFDSFVATAIGEVDIVHFEEEATALVVRKPVVEEHIEFNDVATVKKIQKISATEALIVYTTVIDPGDPPSSHVEETGVTLTAVAARNIVVSAHETLTFQLHASGPIKKADGIEVTATETVTFDTEARHAAVGDGQEQITFHDTASVQLSNTNVKETFEFQDQATCRIVSKLNAAESIVFKTSFTYVVLDGCVEKVYSPFVGDGEGTPPPLDLPAASGDEGFLLQYPAVTPTSEVRLRSPNFGNVHRVALDRVNRTTRGGKLIIFADPVWNGSETLLFVFSALSRDQVSDLKAFYRASLGKKIRLVDYENRAWQGIITQPNDPVVQDGIGCQYTASFEFRGERA